jgi:hypothetical protein
MKTENVVGLCGNQKENEWAKSPSNADCGSSEISKLEQTAIGRTRENLYQSGMSLTSCRASGL